ncbi:MAG: SUMF1/EgtB/PvdO family nonheme iron enzyme [Prevotella sp.]|jgi:formylglycine-generating enzyme required for sulfatase activity|nr:SUMF1/EgtB/PvdO family nonheme iron enzyme [Prevotella sp.]
MRKLFANKYFWWGLGLVIVLIATSVEVFRGRNTNYFDYQDSTRMFWEGLSPYNLEYAQAHQIYFLYSPVFSVLFAPIFYLPWWLGPYIWNIGNYTLFSLAIKWLPRQLEQYKLYIFVFLLSVVLQTVFCYQHNIIVAYIYIFAFILLERGKGFWAVFLIMLSATTKIYGTAELAILFCYSKTLRNFGYAILCGAFFLFLPALNPNFDNVFVLYQQMFDMIAAHHSDSDYIGILFAVGLKPFLLPNYRLVQIAVMGILGILFFWRYKRWSDFRFRVQALGILTGFMILFSDCPETHTYIICLPFYAMAFWFQPKRNWIDWTLFWSLVVNFCILPTDVLCPAWLHEYIHRTFWLDVYTYFFCWLRMIWWAVGPDKELKVESLKLKVLLPLLMLLLPLGAQAQKVPASHTFTLKGVSFKMNFVQGGTFMMGALPNDTLADADEVRHPVKVYSYYIGETEVTQALWEAVMPKNRSKQKGADRPVEYVTYEQCQEFIARLNKMTGKHFRLPTEAEWEYAARGGRKSKGYLYAGSNNPDEVAYTLTYDFDDHHKPVKQLKPNELGLYDMSGNVWEFCEDWYKKTPTSKPSSSFHVIRGGSYDCDARYSRVTNRFMYDQRRRRMEVGFRLVFSVK